MDSLLVAIVKFIAALFKRPPSSGTSVHVPGPRKSGATDKQRLAMAAAIVNYEARRDARGRLMVYELPSWDGGGSFEVAGINDRYHPQMAHKLRDLVEDGRHDEAELEVQRYLIGYTDAVKDLSPIPAIEFFLRDSAFNRGPTGAARILQYALRTDVDGIVGPDTQALLEKAESDPKTLLKALRRGREQYERSPYVGRDESSPPWPGLVNRWNKATKDAESFLPGGRHA